ncbi:MAG TPA: MFS transporter [Methyloceanibacter sp.]|nr:MFS transporter [Methyloceanibacter sp.]
MAIEAKTPNRRGGKRSAVALPRAGGSEGTVVAVLAAISVCHMLNDVIQSLIMAIYPMLKSALSLDFSQIGLITFTFQGTASLLQPVVGYYTDRYPTPYSLVLGMSSSLIGLLLMAFATNYLMVLAAAALIGMGSSVFHPESSRVARLASGGQHGLAQSVFQVGGNFGTALGPLLAAFIVLPNGQRSLAWFSVVALIAMAMLTFIGGWYGKTIKVNNGNGASVNEMLAISSLGQSKVRRSIAILLALTFSKHFYLVSITSFYIFYLIHTFHLTVQSAQVYLFIFLGAVAAGTVIGGPIGDRIGTRRVIWWSILGVLPFTMLLPYVDLFWTAVLSVIIGVILASAFPAIVVYAQGLIPGRVGMVAGLFFGVAFGIAGIGAAVLGWIADQTSIVFVYHVCAFLPAIGLLAAFLPEQAKAKPKARRKTGNA